MNKNYGYKITIDENLPKNSMVVSRDVFESLKELGFLTAVANKNKPNQAEGEYGKD